MVLDFIILGAQKAATSSLHQTLRTVPGIYMPSGESAFFEEPEFRRKPWESFRAPAGSTSIKVGIKRPDNLCREDLIHRICKVRPVPRMLVVLREPCSRAVSAYFHLVRHGHLPPHDLETGLRQALKDWRNGAQTPSSSIIQFGLYGTYLEMWFRLVNPDQFLVMSQSSVKADLQNAAATCARHIGISEPEIPAVIHDSENAGMYDSRWIKTYRLGHLLKTDRIPGTARRVPSGHLTRRVLGSALTQLAVQLGDTSQTAPQLSGSVAGELADIYAADFTVLKSLVPRSAIDWEPR